MGPRIFIASSTQALPLANRIGGWLEQWGASPMPWDKIGLFRPGDYILERLLQLAGEVDAAILIFGDEDRGWYHPDAQPQPRDNVLIEYGIFASRLGRERTLIFRTGEPKAATDLGGLVYVQFGEGGKATSARRQLKDWVHALPEAIRRARDRDADRQQANNAPLPSRIDAAFALPGGDQRLEIVTGSLRDIRNVDVIVSSENTDLEPSRIDERSTSGTLRYLDAERNPLDMRVIRDAYVDALDAAKQQYDIRLPALPGAVVPAPTTGLRAQGVKYVFHAAVVQGMIEAGYRTTTMTIENTVKNCFRALAALPPADAVSSILFPIFGAGTGQLSIDAAVRALLDTIAGEARANAGVKRIVIFAFTDLHRRVVRERAEAMGLAPVN